MKKFALQFSGGRDSLALLHYWKPQQHDTIVFWANPGETLPELAEIVRAATAGWDVREIKTNVVQWRLEHGMPVDIVPVWHTQLGNIANGRDEAQTYTSCLDCCQDNIMLPLQAAALVAGCTVVVRGQRNADKLKAPIQSGAIIDGMQYLFPLQSWTDQDVDEYLKSAGITLPPWYAYGSKGMDCWGCTGYAAESHGLHKYLHEVHPEKYEIVAQRFRDYRHVLNSELSALEI